MLIFRTDASVKTGTGHLMECIALADYLGKESDSLFLINGFEPALDILEKRNYKYKIVPTGLTEKDERDWILGIAKKHDADLLICNLLNRDDSFYVGLSGHNFRVMAIFDDAVERHIPIDYVVNWSILQDKSKYKQFILDDAVYCIGPEYMPTSKGLLCKTLVNAIIRKIVRDPVGTIFVNQGGSDPFCLTAKILRSLEILPLEQNVIVVVGGAVAKEHIKEINGIATSSRNNYQIRHGIEPGEVYAIMEESDMAITAAGNALYELAIFGVPSLVISHHEKHLVVAEEFARRDAAINLGIGSDISEEEIAIATWCLMKDYNARRTLSRNISNITDGLGCMRIAEAML